jgi:hypothetical protein
MKEKEDTDIVLEVKVNGTSFHYGGSLPMSELKKGVQIKCWAYPDMDIEVKCKIQIEQH